MHVASELLGHLLRHFAVAADVTNLMKPDAAWLSDVSHKTLRTNPPYLSLCGRYVHRVGFSQLLARELISLVRVFHCSEGTDSQNTFSFHTSVQNPFCEATGQTDFFAGLLSRTCPSGWRSKRTSCQGYLLRLNEKTNACCTAGLPTAPGRHFVTAMGQVQLDHRNRTRTHRTGSIPAEPDLDL